MGRKKMKKIKKGILTDEEDRISNLPESLIHHILSFLLMRDVIRTCLLSKRWRNIWKSTLVLRFGMRNNEFIEQTLIHYEGQKVKTLQVGLDWLEISNRVESWVRFAAMHVVEELDISVNLCNGTFLGGLFECLEMRVLRMSLGNYSSLQALRIRVGNCYSLPPFRFPLLTELHVTGLNSNYLDTSACPLLEVLIMERLYPLQNLEIRAPNPKLRYLKISEHESYKDFGRNSRLTLYAPNVLHFEFGASFGRFYELKSVSSVKTLSLYSVPEDSNGRMAELLVQLLRNLTRVKSLKLCQRCILILGYAETMGLEIPTLSATWLELEINSYNYLLVGMTSLLRASRCIERLVINFEDRNLTNYEIMFEDHDIDAVKSWESLEHALSVELALTTILIQNYPGYPRYRSTRKGEPNIEKHRFEVKLVKVLLKNCKMLKKMNISIMNLPFQPLKLLLLAGLTKKLQAFPRASVKAEVYFS